MKKLHAVFTVFFVLLLSACGATPQPSIVLDKEYINSPEQRIGVYFKVDQASTHIYGASCLLCYGVASAANSSLTKHFESEAISGIEGLKKVVSDRMQQQGKNVQFVSLPVEIKKLPKFKKTLGFPHRDFRSLKEKLNIDTLIVVDIKEHGAYRQYNAYVPTTDPMGAVEGEVYTVDLNTNRYVQYEKLSIRVNASGEWDEPPSFPGVTGSYYEALEKAKERINALF
ncbi:hypothetical protein [Thalassomonas haliotis]|uniref:Lipoprotein n=1 Tax=Thalassomonas haliotis TaxID=485448 RepID=A0ABY7VHH6_9GAMM|nr:hypothetical protein [Thalassomonas haliotis]WDE12862.1 hypothetical protein H3N35_05200 [Thalassomonas haliotis]